MSNMSNEDAEEVLALIDEMLEHDEMDTVHEFLSSVREWIIEKDFITERQHQGVMNCYEVYQEKLNG